MLKRFEVKGFKQFEHLVWDFSKIRDYDYNVNCVSDGVIKDGLVYGANASGKTNLGLALFDIVANLTDNDSNDSLYQYYLKADKDAKTADFCYDFQFDTHNVRYIYSKLSHKVLSSETLFIDDILVVNWPVNGGVYIEKNFLHTYKFGEIPWNKESSDLSFIKYIFNNMVASADSVLSKMKKFVNGMLWFQRTDNLNTYIGFSNSSENIFDYIIRNNYIHDFEIFLNKFAGLDIKLVAEKKPDGSTEIYINYKNRIPLSVTASSGTRALSLFYYWMKHKEGMSLLFIDEFDAFYHFDLAKKVLKYLIADFKGQALLTTHNIDLLTNQITRPDCCFILNNAKIKSFADATKRTLRQSNNLERLYVGGEFNE